MTFAERLLDFLYQRKAMKDREATTKVPSETPIPVPILADRSRPAEIAVEDGRAGVGAEVVVDVDTVVWRTEAERVEGLETLVGGAEEAVEFTVARILLNTLGEIRS